MELEYIRGVAQLINQLRYQTSFPNRRIMGAIAGLTTTVELDAGAFSVTLSPASSNDPFLTSLLERLSSSSSSGILQQEEDGEDLKISMVQDIPTEIPDDVLALFEILNASEGTFKGERRNAVLREAHNKLLAYLEAPAPKSKDADHDRGVHQLPGNFPLDGLNTELTPKGFALIVQHAAANTKFTSKDLADAGLRVDQIVLGLDSKGAHMHFQVKKGGTSVIRYHFEPLPFYGMRIVPKSKRA